MEFTHIPVLLQESIDFLMVIPGKQYIDMTAGGGGYTSEILKRGGRVLAIDQDKDSIEYLQTRSDSGDWNLYKDQLVIVEGNFADVKNIVSKYTFENIDGIVFDLGFSSNQIEKSGRGFSFRKDEPLDMRMSVATKFTARDILKRYSKEDLYDLLIRGEEHNASKIAHAIVATRSKHSIDTTKDLVDVVQSVVPQVGITHPATKVFQAIRMEVNQEIAHLQKALEEGLEILAPGGKMVIVSFHSLEDRLVKNTFKKWTVKGLAESITKKPVTATIEEVQKNRRSRSAKVRAIKKN